MPNIAALLKIEISRIARREVRAEVLPVRKAAASQRTQIAALKRQVDGLQKQLRAATRAARNEPVPVGNDADDATRSSGRFSPKGLASQRKRLGLSAEEVGLLVGASNQSIYNWEAGKARPNSRHLPALFALKKLGRQAAATHLASLRAA